MQNSMSERVPSCLISKTDEGNCLSPFWYLSKNLPFDSNQSSFLLWGLTVHRFKVIALSVEVEEQRVSSLPASRRSVIIQQCQTTPKGRCKSQPVICLLRSFVLVSERDASDLGRELLIVMGQEKWPKCCPHFLPLISYLMISSLPSPFTGQCCQLQEAFKKHKLANKLKKSSWKNVE